jgi:hypothetical protein
MRILILTCLAALSAFAGDVNGNWKATAEGPNGSMERTFQFKVDGEKLTGETVSSWAGKSAIMDGTVKGDTVKFVINVNLQGNEMKVSYTGKLVNDDEMKLTAEVSGNTIEWAAKRQK